MPSELMVGDIVLTINPRAIGHLNAAYQRERRREEVTHRVAERAFWPTHAILVVAPDVIAHSNMGIGVTFEGIDRLFETHRPESILVLRHPEVKRRNFGYMDILNAASYYLDQRYNPLIELGSSESRSFCSEFVYKTLIDLSLSLPERTANTVFPLDFLIWADVLGWEVIPGSEVWERPIALPNGAYLSDHSAEFISDGYRAIILVIKNVRSILNVLVLTMELMTKNLAEGKAGRVHPDDKVSGEQVYKAAACVAQRIKVGQPTSSEVPVSLLSISHWTLRNIPELPDAIQKADDLLLDMSQRLLDAADWLCNVIIGHLREALRLFESDQSEASQQRFADLMDDCIRCVNLIDVSEDADVVQSRLSGVHDEIDRLLAALQAHLVVMRGHMERHMAVFPEQSLPYEAIHSDLVEYYQAFKRVIPFLSYQRFEQLRLHVHAICSKVDASIFFKEWPHKLPDHFVRGARSVISSEDYWNRTIEMLTKMNEATVSLLPSSTADTSFIQQQTEDGRG